MNKKLILSFLALTGLFCLNAMDRKAAATATLKKVITQIRGVDESRTHFIQTLIEHGADINDSDDEGNSLLMQAIKEGNYIAVETLIHCGADVNWVNHSRRRENPVFWAIKYDQPKILELLVNSGADIYSDPEEDSFTPLTYAFHREQFDMARFLIDKGVNLHGTDKKGDSPLVAAILHKQKDIVELLIEKGVAIDEPDQLGNTPIMYAADAPSLEIVQLLFNHNASLDTISNEHPGGTITEFAAGSLLCEHRFHNPHYQLKEYLKTQAERIAILTWLFDVKHLPIDTPHNQTALSCAVETGLEDIAKFLIERGADINAVSWNGSVWDNAMRYDENTKIIKFLIEKDITYNLQESLIDAIATGHFQIIKVLLDHVETILRNGTQDALLLDTTLTNALNSLQFSLFIDPRAQQIEIERFSYTLEGFYRLLSRNSHLLPQLRHACLTFPTHTPFSGRVERGFGNAATVERARTIFQRILCNCNFKKMLSTFRKNILG